VPTAQRVAQNTRPEINERIRRQTEANIAYYAQHPDQIDRRLRELDEEWDTERTLETWFSVVGLTGITLSITSSRRWILLPYVALGFFLQHALQGWCPPLPLFRRLGVRTAQEIERERTGLLALCREGRSAQGPPAEFASQRRSGQTVPVA
jgi:hypothetical protein